MILDLLLALLSIVLLLVAAVRQPQVAYAPPGWHVHGVRPDGAYELLRAPTWPEPRCSPTPNACVGEEPLRRVQGRVYCGAGRRAIAVSAVVVGCQR